MGYNRDNAVSYASTYWDKVCHDGCVAIINKRPYVKAKAGADIEELGTKDEHDCTHFVSCCLGTPGGGLRIQNPRGPVGMAYGILSATDLVNYLLSKGFAKAIIQKASREKAQEHISKLQPGDVIAYFGLTRFGPNRDYHHTTLHLGKGLIASHTTSHYDYDFCNVGASADTVTLLHII